MNRLLHPIEAARRHRECTETTAIPIVGDWHLKQPFPAA